MTRFAGEAPGIGDLLKALVGGGTISTEEAREKFNEPRKEYLLDPAEAARAAGASEQLAVVESLLGRVRERESIPLDKGSVELDRFLRGLGISSNLSGASRTPTFVYPLEPGVTYKREMYQPRKGGMEDPSRPGTVVEFVKFDDTPMMDWDTPSDYHLERNVTVRHLGDVEELVREYVSRHPDATLQLYQTPGGFRAWELGRRATPQQFQEDFEQLKVDGGYAWLASQGRAKEVDGVTYDGPGYSSRISHKPGRVDWVAQPIARIAGSEALPDPLSKRRVEVYHDAPIRRAYLTDGGVSAQAIEALQAQIPTASQALQKELVRRFGR